MHRHSAAWRHLSRLCLHKLCHQGAIHYVRDFPKMAKKIALNIYEAFRLERGVQRKCKFAHQEDGETHPGAAEVFRAKKSSGNYHDKMNGEHYEKLFSQKLLPQVPPSSAIVMHNPPYHFVKRDKLLRMSSLKRDIQAWLYEKGVTWCSNMVKAELMKLVDNVNICEDRYRVNCIAKAAGHLVVHLPPYHYQLNPIELLWSDVKGFVAGANKTFKLHDVEPLVWHGVKQVTAEKCKRYVEHVLNQEDLMRKLDHIIDDVVDHGNQRGG
ncbi:hypothetical protein HPB50_023537 [Hyalomma asiaticum]|uniref:Uncharacterized protein n=1 Tax=Hyalomma asiaticum TaxID=266040 RepID=A0ACB7TSH5_HYAAI|nr:hypothetical protein HPB50_023537 [Hyalomma asiaticum]